ncbi:nitrogen fixation/metabolism regulation signal transduction histidine kinase [Halarchaeum rubridurum]|uniref:Nitrogen fixation/metabolism regulation signal transduction histidine kinase n=1 Tax=Halarchaeum rubridurum TaxID=489911 RepID=A0A830G1U3_9EURY|nr:hypothetical protein [Halarchaeum rubridurum]MBP1954914.1 nitrogen fixation/metabolism regulation signal transduction histidine kinase [Halarchaeum rubridurum]GGM70412.1 hypothetical protein GCM10009017_20770 [Halarchaeum rubridurum]
MSEKDGAISDLLPEESAGLSLSLTPGLSALLTVFGVVVSALVLAGVGYALDFHRQEVVVTVVSLAVLIFLGVGYALFRAMIAATNRDENAGNATTHPAFLLLFVFLAFLVAVYLAFLYSTFYMYL